MTLKEKGKKKYNKLIEKYKTNKIAEYYHYIEVHKEKIENHKNKINELKEDIEKIEEEKIEEIEIEKMIMNGELKNLE